AAPSPTPSLGVPRSIAVSVPPDPVALHPGESAAIPIRVVNPGTSPVTVTVKSEGITLGDNGTTAFTGRPDPLWAGRTVFPNGDITISAQHFVDLSVTVRVPARIGADLYYIGFLVSPVPQVSGVVVVINQIGAFLTIDVPGPRVRALSADLSTVGFNWGPIHLNTLVIGDHVDGRLMVHNIGPSSVLFSGENDVTSTPITGSPAQQRISRSLLPIGRSRWFTVTAQPAFPIDLVTMTDVVTYPDRTGTGTLEIVRTKTVLVISPWVIVAVVALLALLGGWRLRSMRRHRLERRAAARVTGARRGRSKAA
ncbi:MAG: hypothetical protein QOE18_508, partial [Chloroflexota bacterium]|nr:hypothetical protein [Chloroflexota bacterium]